MDTAAGLLGYKPKHAIISDIIRKQIVSGKFQKGDKLLPDEDLALKYKVNKQTVANGLNALVLEGLLERAPRRGTIVIKEKESKKVSNAVGMLMLGEGDVFSDIFRGITQRFSGLGLYPVLIDSRMSFDKNAALSFLKSFISEPTKPYGILIDGLFYSQSEFDFMKENADSFHNTVFFTHYSPEERIAFAKYALVDLNEAGKLAAKHFIGRGHRKINCLALPELKNTSGTWNSIQVAVMMGFAEECRSAGVAFDEEIFWSLLHGAPVDVTLNSLLKGKNRPTAIYSYSDFFVRNSVIPYLEAKGLKPMKDVELIGFYNTHHAEECGFSSICIHEDKIAEAAVKLLTGETDEREILIKPELVVRTAR